jgi:DNA-binding NarL/FixJ family response regulator
MNKIKVILVEDLKIIRIGIKSLLRDVENISIVGDVESANALFKLMNDVIPDILILDIQLPGMS